MKAVSTFDYEKGARFATYARRCIDADILMLFRTFRTPADVSIDAHARYYCITAATLPMVGCL